MVNVWAKVKGNELDCYEWDEGDRLIIKKVLDVLSEEYNIYLYNVINVDKKEYGAVTSDQI